MPEASALKGVNAASQARSDAGESFSRPERIRRPLAMSVSQLREFSRPPYQVLVEVRWNIVVVAIEGAH